LTLVTLINFKVRHMTLRTEIHV